MKHGLPVISVGMPTATRCEHNAAARRIQCSKCIKEAKRKWTSIKTTV